MRNWKEICAKCANGEIEPECEYYGEPNGCNSPTYQEHPHPGNAAAMREALCEIVLLCRKVGVSIRGDVACGIIAHKARVALAAPARNCDKYATADEALRAQQAAYEESNFENGECKLGCPGCDDFPIRCEVRWLFATEKGDEA